MVLHVVLYRPRPGLSADERRALIDAFESALAAIPNVGRVRVGRRLRHGAQYEAEMVEDLEYAAILEFENLDGLRAYLRHPAHRELGARFLASMAAGCIYDYDVQDWSGLRDWRGTL